MRPIIVVGSINMDVVTRTNRLPRPGETVAGQSVHFIPGGKGSNQAIAASRLQGAVRLVGKLGQDAFGESLRTFFQTESLDVSGVQTIPTAPTGTALIVVDDHSENTIVVVGGANLQNTVEDVEHLPMSGNEIIVSQFEIPHPTVLALFRKAKSVGATTILNPAPAAQCPPEILALSDILIINETELAFFANSASVPETPDAITTLATQLRTRPEQIILVTLGAKGVLAFTPNGVIEVAGRVVKAIDTTGAGDCFVGALAVALSENQSLHRALEFANLAAALSVQKLGASSSMPTRAELEAAR
ncbi:MAG: ribokinase [Anaerolineae bacterium]|nr:ribokinase [Anaerolineae bacterium]